MLLEMFSALLATVLRGFREELTPALHDLEMVDPQTVEQAIPTLAALVRKYRKQAGAVANQFMAEAAAEAGGQALVPPVEGYPDKAVYKVLQESNSLDEITGALERHVRTAARRQIVRSVPVPVVPPASETNPGKKEAAETDDGLLEGKPAQGFEVQPADGEPTSQGLLYPVAWARVLTGKDNCPFCIMLAARGPVYSSAHHAKYRSSTRWQGQARSWANSYHDHCDCLVVPVYDTERWAGKAQADALYKVYEKVTRAETAGGKKISEGNDKLKAWSDYLRELEKDGKKLEYPALSESNLVSDAFKANKPKEPGKNTGHTHALRSTWPEHEKPLAHELDFIRRFEKHGYSAQWIARPEIAGKPGQYAPSNDFYWVEKDFQATELKTSKNKYSTISTRIKDAVQKARKHEVPVAKENFVIDLGAHPLSDKLRYQLSEYNLRKPEAAIVSLWVMHSNGEAFEEIKLQ